MRWAGFKLMVIAVNAADRFSVEPQFPTQLGKWTPIHCNKGIGIKNNELC